MPTQVWRPGDYRVCPKCKTRHKVQDLRCAQCSTVLAGVPVRHAAAPAVVTTATGPSRALRAVLAVGLVVALGAGLWVRSLFRGASLQDAVEASSATAPIPAAEPSFTPPVLSYPPAVGYSGGGVPSEMASLTIQPSTAPLPAYAIPVSAPPSVEPAAPVTGMTSVAPSGQPTSKTTFTNDDLGRGRTEPPAAMLPAATGASLGAVADSVRPASSVSNDEVRKWTSRLRDREDDLREAQSKVRRFEAEAAVKRAQAEAMAASPEAREKAAREVSDALEDLEKAERKLSEKQRDLDEAKSEARAAGVRFEN